VPRHDEEYEIRREQHLRRLKTRQPRCSRCSEGAPAALSRRGDVLLCYECLAVATGRAVLEGHHLFGRRNDPAMTRQPGNRHRELTDSQRDWPQETLRNPYGSPLRRVAAAERSVQDFNRVASDRAAGFPLFLEALDFALTAHFGREWWVPLGLAEWAA